MTFGEKMRALMAARNLSLRRLSAIVHYDVSLLSKVSRDLRIPSEALANGLDVALGANGELGALRPSQRTKCTADPVVVGHQDILEMGAAAGVRRRHRGMVAPELADYFSDQLAGHYIADRHLGPLRLISTTIPQYELLCELANSATADLRPKMWALACGYSGLIGWLFQDGGDLSRAGRWHDVMIEHAHRAMDPQLVAFALHNKAMLLSDMADGPGVIDLTRAALAHENVLMPKVRILALQQAAHGTSLVGGDRARDECDRLLDNASDLLDQVDDPHPWGGACRTPHYLDVQRATCYVRLGLAGEALKTWERVLPALEGGALRDLGVFRARQAQAFALVGEPEQAIQIAAEVVETAAATGSARMARELRGLETRMGRWAKDGPGRTLGAMLATLGESP